MCTNIYKESKSLFFNVMKNSQIFLQKFDIFNMITDSFLVEKWGTLEPARKHVCKNLLNLDCQGSIRFGIFPSCLKMKNHLGRVSFFHFLQNVLIEA